MKTVFRLIGRVAYWCGWPVFWMYFQLGHGRTRVIVQRGDTILVVKQWIGDGRWQLPGGGLHTGELPAAGALRELREETGIVVAGEQLRPLGEAVHRSRGFTFTMHVFATTWHGTALRLQRHEIAEARWVRASELTASSARPDVLVALQMIQ